jgi:hypothetical protein
MVHNQNLLQSFRWTSIYIVPQVGIRESHWLTANEIQATFRTVLPGKVFFYIRTQSNSQMYTPTPPFISIIKI